MKRVLVFGTGKFYRDYRKFLTAENGILVIGFLDNNEEKAGFVFEGRPVY